MATVSWLHDGGEILNSSRTLISTKGNLTISPVIKADQGSYVCRAVHPLGTRDSQEAVLTVKGIVGPVLHHPVLTFFCNHLIGCTCVVVYIFFIFFIFIFFCSRS